LGHPEALEAMNERLTVLIVDDEQPVLVTAAAVLSEDFRVLTASDAAEALRLLKHHTVDVLCTDFNMPGRNGIQLLREAMARQPHLSGVLVTGHAEYLQERDTYDAQGLYYLLIKPYLPTRLVEIVQRAAESARLRRVMSSLTLELGARSLSTPHGSTGPDP
jgi:two-component system response regulator HupR/HoxA